MVIGNRKAAAVGSEAMYQPVGLAVVRQTLVVSVPDRQLQVGFCKEPSSASTEGVFVHTKRSIDIAT
jgi:hypothetical protein